MDKNGNKPDFTPIIVSEIEGGEKRDPNDLHFDDFCGKGIRVGQPVPNDLQVTWCESSDDEGVIGIVHCKDFQSSSKLFIEKHKSSGLIARCQLDIEEKIEYFNGQMNMHESLNMYAAALEDAFNVPSLYLYDKEKQERRAIFRFATTTLIISEHHYGNQYHLVSVKLFHNDVEHCLEKAREAHGDLDWKLDDEWNEELWLKQDFTSDVVRYRKGL